MWSYDSQDSWGASYFVTFIDYASRKVCAYALKTKNQVLETFKQFHAQVEREMRKLLKSIRTNNGGKYRGQFEEYYRKHGILHEKVVPKTLQYNGAVEIMNCTIVEKVRCMLSHAKLSKSSWGEPMNTTIHLINLSPLTPLKGDVVKRVWRKKDVSYGYLTVFDCSAFRHVPKDERSKLDKSKQCIFLSYVNEEVGYRLWDPIGKKLIRSKDVVFLENQNIEDCEKVEKPQPVVDDFIDMDPTPPSVAHDDGRAMQDEHNGVIHEDNTPIGDVE